MESIANAAVPTPLKSPIEFEFTMDAATHNSNLLEQVGYNLGKFINNHPGSTISYGSELRPVEQLEPLLIHHPSYERFKLNHLNGIDYPVNDLSKEDRISMLDRSIERGNHKSALNEEQRPTVTKLMAQDVELGFGIPLTIESVRKMPGAEVYPVGCQDQLTINERGEVIPKKRVTHDLSHNRKEGQSVNQRVREEEIPGVIFGYAMLRMLRMIHHLRWNHPNDRILCNKIDM